MARDLLEPQPANRFFPEWVRSLVRTPPRPPSSCLPPFFLSANPVAATVICPRCHAVVAWTDQEWNAAEQVCVGCSPSWTTPPAVGGVAAVGGWVDTTTLQKVYQVADADTMESVVLQPKRLWKLG